MEQRETVTPAETINHAESAWWQQVLVPLLIIALAQVARVLFPIMFEIGEDWDFLLAGLVALGTFAAPLLALGAGRLSARTSLAGGAALVGGALVLLRALDPIPAAVAIGAVAVALAGATLVVARASLGSPIDSGALVPAIVLGLGVDAALRAGFGSWDLAWQDSPASWVVVLLIAGGLLATAAYGARDESRPTDRAVAPMFWVALGAYLMLQLLFLQNFAFVGSQAGVSFAVAVLVVLVGDLAAVAAAYGALRMPPASAIEVAAGVAAAALAWVLPQVEGALSWLVVIAVQALVTSLLARASIRRPPHEASARRSILALAAGSVVFLAFVLLWSLHIDQPLPFPRQALVAVAVVIVSWVGLRPATREASVLASVTVPAMAVVAGLTVVTPIALWASQPSPEPAPSVSNAVRLVSYNARGAVDTDGQLAPDRIVAEIVSSDPDIVVLQEAARGWPIHGTMDLVAYLQRHLEMDYVYVSAADGQFGNAIFSRLPATEIASGQLPKDGSQHRGYTVVRIETGVGDLVVAGTHIHSRSRVQVTALLEAIDATARLVVAGDMNIAPDDPEVELFTDAGLVDVIGATGDPCRTTSAEPASECDRPDWVFVTPDVAIAEVRIGTGGASDHLAIHVTLSPGS